MTDSFLAAAKADNSERLVNLVSKSSLSQAIDGLLSLIDMYYYEKLNDEVFRGGKYMRYAMEVKAAIESEFGNAK